VGTKDIVSSFDQKFGDMSPL